MKIAQERLGTEAGCHSRDVKRVAIWGNHSSTLYPDLKMHDRWKAATSSSPTDLGSRRIYSASPATWRRHYCGTRPSSSLSAANAAIETVRSICELTPADTWHSVSICSDGSYVSTQVSSPPFQHALMAIASRLLKESP